MLQTTNPQIEECKVCTAGSIQLQTARKCIRVRTVWPLHQTLHDSLSFSFLKKKVLLLWKGDNDFFVFWNHSRIRRRSSLLPHWWSNPLGCAQCEFYWQTNALVIWVGKRLTMYQKKKNPAVFFYTVIINTWMHSVQLEWLKTVFFAMQLYRIIAIILHKYIFVLGVFQLHTVCLIFELFHCFVSVSLPLPHIAGFCKVIIFFHFSFLS